MSRKQAIQVFELNIKDLLMAAPAGMQPTMGIDPGLITGVRIALVHATGKLLATDTVYPHIGQVANAVIRVAHLCLEHQAE